MSKNVADLRFHVVADTPLASSGAWRLWLTKKGDLYLASRFLAHITKVSFHRSGICRDAFTQQHGTVVAMPDRLKGRWLRPEIPPFGSEHFARLCWLAVPTDYLSRRSSLSGGHMTVIPAAPTGMATFVEIGLTRQSRFLIERAMEGSVRSGVLMHAKAFEDVFAFARWYHGDWENRDMNIPASHGAEASLQFLASDGAYERPVRLTFHRPAKDREALLLTELGGRVRPGQEGLNWVARSP